MRGGPRARRGRNISEVERWLSIAAGRRIAGYGLSAATRTAALMLAATRRAAGQARRRRDTATPMSSSASIPPGPGRIRDGRSAAAPACIVDESVTINQPVETALSLLAQPREPAARSCVTWNRSSA